MNVLGLHYGHNATLCLLTDGRVTFLQSEERLNRIKNSTGFPSRTLAYLYDNVIEGPQALDHVVLYQRTHTTYEFMKHRNFQPTRFGIDAGPEAVDQIRKLPPLINRARWAARDRRNRRRLESERYTAEVLEYFSSQLGVPATKIDRVMHHDAHAFAAVPNIDGETVVFTLDGTGDGECATVQLWDGETMRSLSRTDHRHSLGFYYAYTTSLLGMQAGEHEFKVMGLAPYANADRAASLAERLRSLITVDNGEWHSRASGLTVAAKLEALFRFQRFDTIAGAMQLVAEELICDWVRHWVRTTGCRQVAVGGGVFMNVKACQRLAEMREVQSLYVVPSAGDESCAIGAAVSGALAHGEAVRPITHLYLGMTATADEVEAAISDVADRYDIRRDVTPDDVAQLLANGEVVARFDSPMEYGARALGNRSILADPSRRGVVEYINAMVKNRDFWMPFAPSILDEDMDRYVEPTHATFAPHMTITFRATELGRRDLAAAVHPRDGSVRPQQVIREWNPAYYDLIAAFRERTGIGAVLNTSLNLHGEPNVGTPTDAIRTLDQSGMRYLLLGATLLEKRKPSRAAVA